MTIKFIKPGILVSLSSFGNYSNKNFLLLGYWFNLFSGTHARTFNISWFKILRSIYKTTSKLPLGIGKYRVGLFADIGKVWDDNYDIGYQVGVGVELSFEIKVGLALDVPLSRLITMY